MLLGQKVPCPPFRSTKRTTTQWLARAAEGKALSARAYRQADALALLGRRPDLLEELTRTRSWMTSGGELMNNLGPGRGLAGPRVEPNLPPRARGRYDHLFIHAD